MGCLGLWPLRAALAQDATGSGGAAVETGAGAPSQITAPPSVLPATGFVSGDNGSPASVRLGDLGQQVAGSFLPPSAAAGPEWQFTPSLGATEELTDNGQTASASGKKRGDLITTLQPGIAVSGDTPRVQVNLAYNPQIYLYARDGSQNRIDHEFNGRVLATLLPQTLFLDLRGVATQQAVSGGVGPLASNTLSSSNTQQDFSFSALPYLVHRFGGFGSGEIGYGVTRSVQNASTTFSTPRTPVIPSPFNPLNPLNPFANPALLSAGNQRTTTQNAHAAFVTGEDFGRYNGTALASITKYDGTGVLSGAHRDIFTLDSGYALTRTVTLLATLGWENIRYGGTAPVRIDDAIWDFGTRLSPNADSTLTIRYGHHDGLDSLTIDGSLSPTPRTRLYVRYSKGLTTNQEELQNALATTDLDALGNPVDHGTGAPIYDASNFFGVQDNLERLRRISISGAYVLDRDTVTITIESDDTTVISQASAVQQPGAIGSNSGTFGSVAWQREVSPRLTGSLYLQYGVRTVNGPPATTQDELATTASVSYALGPTVSTSLEVSHSQTTGGGTGSSDRQNLVLLSVVKTF